MMRAVTIHGFGGPEVLGIETVPVPHIGDSQILIKVQAAGVNRPDIFQRKGNYPAPKGVPTDIPGLEVAGYVSEIGKDVHSFQIGDRVMALVAGGGYAEYVAVDEGCCLPIPIALSFEAAASLPENIYTVWHNVFERGQLSAGEKFLVHGGAGGIGYTAIQLAKLSGAEVFTTVGTDEKADFVQALGADHVVQYHRSDFEEVWQDYKMDVILDSIGGVYFDKNFRLLQEDGRLVYINAVDGAQVSLNLLKLMQKRIVLTGSTLRARDIAFKRHLTKAIHERVWPLLADGRFRIKVDRVFDLAEAAEAHQYMESNQHLGKVVLKVR